MATLESRLIVSLIDRLSAPAKGISAQLGRLTAASQANAAKMTALRGQMLGAVGAGYALYKGLSAPLSAAIGFESKLEDIGQKINAPINALPKLGQEIRKVARDTTQSASAMAEGMDILAGMGAGRDDALALLNPIGKAATAYKAEIGDLAKAGYAALDNLKVPALEFGKALDAMAAAGKAGAFELKDMAQYFPALGAAYQGLGQKGVPAVADLSAALQIVRKGAGDSSEAATNLSNILQKVNAPQTRKAFAKMGVNLEKEMKKAAKAGMTPLEAITEITNRTLKGDLSKLGDLFQDAQVQKGLRPLIQNLELYRQIRAEAMAAQGTVEEDYRRRLLTGEIAAKRFSIAIENINNSVGAALLPALADLADTLVPIVNRMADWAEANPGLTRGLVAATSALIGFKVASIGLRYAGLFMKGGLIDAGIVGLRGLSMASGAASFALAPLGRAMGLMAPSARSAAKEVVATAAATLSQRQAAFQAALAMQGLAQKNEVVGVSMKQATASVREAGAALVAAQGDMKVANAALAATGPSVGIATRAFQGLKVALISSGVGLALVGIAAAGTWIYNNWTGISTAFEAFKGAFMRAVEPIMPTIQPVLDGFSWLWEKVSNLLDPIDEMGGGWTRAGLAAGKFVGDAVVAVVELPGKILAIAGDMLDAGIALAQSMWDGIQRKIDEMIAWFKGLPGRVISAIGSIDIGSLIKWPTPPAWLSRLWGGGGTPSGNANPDAGRAVNTMLDGMEKRASGGPVQGGRTYLVGERGPELFSPSRSGFISPNEVYARVAAASPGQRTSARPSPPAATINVGGIHVHGVSDPTAIAHRVRDILSRELAALSRGAFSDGVA